MAQRDSQQGEKPEVGEQGVYKRWSEEPRVVETSTREVGPPPEPNNFVDQAERGRQSTSGRQLFEASGRQCQPNHQLTCLQDCPPRQLK